MGEHAIDLSARRETPAACVEARVRAARAFYQHAVATYLAAPGDEERLVAGEVMYFAQLATIEARFNPEGSARFRALADARMAAAADAAVVGLAVAA